MYPSVNRSSVCLREQKRRHQLENTAAFAVPTRRRKILKLDGSLVVEHPKPRELPTFVWRCPLKTCLEQRAEIWMWLRFRMCSDTYVRSSLQWVFLLLWKFHVNDDHDDFYPCTPLHNITRLLGIHYSTIRRIKERRSNQANQNLMIFGPANEGKKKREAKQAGSHIVWDRNGIISSSREVFGKYSRM